MRTATITVLLLCLASSLCLAKDISMLHFRQGLISVPRSLDDEPKPLNLELTGTGKAVDSTIIPAPGDNKAAMKLVISSSETALSNVSNAFFTSYACNSPCTVGPDTITDLTIPYGKAKVAHRLSNVAVSLPDSVWSLNKTNPVLISDFNDNVDKYTDSNLVYGWIGLGVDGDAKNNYKDPNNAIFGVKFDSYEKGTGTVAFRNETEYCTENSARGKFTTDNNWKMTLEKFSVNGVDLTVNVTDPDKTTTLSFDVQYGYTSDNFFSLPLSFNTILKSTFSNITGTSCTYQTIGDLDILMSCEYDGDLINLPTFTFSTLNGDSITFTPKDYVRKFADGKQKTIFSIAAPFTQDNTIVLGWPVMRDYYTLFTSTNNVPKIELYYNPAPNDGPTPKPDDKKGLSAGAIAGIVLGVVAVVAAGVYFYVKHKKNSNSHALLAN